ncbi:MAG: hypothetical protein ABFS24_00060 [Pseudomonadota bacterium]
MWTAPGLSEYPLKQMGTDLMSIAPDTADTGTAKVIQHPAAKVEDSVCLVEPGQYDLGFIACKTYWIFKRAKMAIWFRILSPGPAFGMSIARHYNLKHVNKRGGFKVGPHSDL